ncbi:hypothetical protein MPF_0356 [Methanohalophilus portucalensis FDF-1]|nr:hypothetical protein MPF_0356 [Methanohalophilus portucalensis FDF-1]
MTNYRYLQNIFENNNKKNQRAINYKAYMNYTLGFFKSISNVSNKTIIVDSSKNPQRALNLSLNPNIELVLIHLVRDSRGVVWSNMKKERKSLGSIKAYILTNLRSEIVYKKTISKKIRIRYEDFVSDSTKIFEKIGEASGIELQSLSEKAINDDLKVNGHILAGNRMAYNSDIKIKQDQNWKHRMPYNDRFLTTILTYPFLKKYGYI